MQGFIRSLAEQKGVEVDTASLDKGSASEKIEDLKGMPADSTSQSHSSGPTTSQGDQQEQAALDQDPSSWTTGGEDATQKQRAYSELLLFSPGG